MWHYRYTEELYHHGIKGMKWGIRKSKPYAKSNLRGKIGLQFFAKNAKDFPTVKLSKKEYAHVMSELMTNITDSQKKSPVIHKLIGKHLYIFENNYDDTYRVIGKRRNPGTTKRRS